MLSPKQNLRTLTLLRVLGRFHAEGTEIRPRNLVAPGHAVANEWNALGIDKVYPSPGGQLMYLPQLYEAIRVLQSLGFVEDRVEERKARLSARYFLTERGVRAAALIGDDWQQWQPIEQLAEQVKGEGEGDS